MRPVIFFGILCFACPALAQLSANPSGSYELRLDKLNPAVRAILEVERRSEQRDWQPIQICSDEEDKRKYPCLNLPKNPERWLPFRNYNRGQAGSEEDDSCSLDISIPECAQDKVLGSDGRHDLIIENERIVIGIGDPFTYNKFYRANGTFDYYRHAQGVSTFDPEPKDLSFSRLEIDLDGTQDEREGKPSGVYLRARAHRSESFAHIDPTNSEFDQSGVFAEIEVETDEIEGVDFKGQALFGLYYRVAGVRILAGVGVQGLSLPHHGFDMVPVAAGGFETERFELYRPQNPSLFRRATLGGRALYTNRLAGEDGVGVGEDPRAQGEIELRVLVNDHLQLNVRYAAIWRDLITNSVQDRENHELFVNIEYLFHPAANHKLQPFPFP